MEQLRIKFPKQRRYRVIQRVCDGKFLKLDENTNTYYFVENLEDAFSTFFPLLAKKICDSVGNLTNEKCEVKDF